MNKFYFHFGNSVSFLVIGLAVAIASQSVLAESKEPNFESSPTLDEYGEIGLVNQHPATNLLTQFTSVSQLSDVQPTDWAFQALQSLVERYGCIAGYPNGTYRGNRALTRYEFAAGLNACLNRVNELIATATTNLVSKEDLATLQKLQKEFAAELATLHGRVDALEAHTSELSANQFSTTTKLTGEVILAVTGGSSGNSGIRNSNTTPGVSPSGDLNQRGDANPTVVARARINLSTSFTGKDLLFMQLQSGNGGQTAGVLGQDPGLGGNVRFNTFDLDYSNAGPSVALNYLFYKFPLSQDLQVSLGAVDAVNNYVDINNYFQDEAASFSSTFFKNNPLLFPVPGGAVASVNWNPDGGAFSLHGVYAALSAQFPNQTSDNNQGLFGAPYQGTVEMEFAPKKGNFAVRLQYTNASVNQRDYNIGGVNAEWAATPKIALFGRYSFGSIDGRVRGSFDGFANTSFTSTTLNPATWMVGAVFPDLFIQGAKGAIAVGQPFIESNVGNSTQTNMEAFYRILISENISITPDLQLIFNVNNNSANSMITVGTIRTVFNF